MKDINICLRIQRTIKCHNSEISPFDSSVEPVCQLVTATDSDSSFTSDSNTDAGKPTNVCCHRLHLLLSGHFPKGVLKAYAACVTVPPAGHGMKVIERKKNAKIRKCF